MTASTASGVRLEDGELLWTYPRASNGVANCTTPVVDGDSVFLSSGYGAGPRWSKCPGTETRYGKKKRTTTRTSSISMEVCCFRGPCLRPFEGSVERTHGFVCLDFRTGEVAWKEQSLGQCSITYADGHLYCLTEDGITVLVEANPEKYVEKGRFVFKAYSSFTRDDLSQQDDKPTWAHPVICNGKLFYAIKTICTATISRKVISSRPVSIGAVKDRTGVRVKSHRSASGRGLDWLESRIDDRQLKRFARKRVGSTHGRYLTRATSASVNSTEVPDGSGQRATGRTEMCGDYRPISRGGQHHLSRIRHLASALRAPSGVRTASRSGHRDVGQRRRAMHSASM